jgi:predicted alpha/beta superfamily hydrolase
MKRMALILFACAAAFAEEPRPLTVDRTVVRTLLAKSNGVAYKLYVALPHDYGKDGRRYPVVYLLDADYSFLIARNIADHLAERDHLRDLILVGIAYDRPPQYRLNRTRDYTPVFSPDGGYGREMQKVSGGGPKFRAFLEKELIPFIDATYRTTPGDRCLVGHSYGGLFSAWTLLTEPLLFRRFIIVSPSLWYDEGMIFGMEQERSKKGAMPARVYMATGSLEGNGDMAADLRRLASNLRRRGYRDLAIESDVLAAETHNSVFPRALSNGLRFVFEGR